LQSLYKYKIEPHRHYRIIAKTNFPYNRSEIATTESPQRPKATGAVIMISSLQPTRPKVGSNSTPPTSNRFSPMAPHSHSHQQTRSYASTPSSSMPHIPQQMQTPVGIISYQSPRPTSNLGLSPSQTQSQFQHERPRTQMEALPPSSGQFFNPSTYIPQPMQHNFVPRAPYDASKRHPVFYPTAEERLRRLPSSDTVSSGGWTSPVAMGYEIESQAARRREGGGKL